MRALVSHQCGPGSIPGLGVICGLSLLLVLVLALRGFSPGTPVFPSPQKPTFPNSNSNWKESPNKSDSWWKASGCLGALLRDRRGRMMNYFYKCLRYRLLREKANGVELLK